MSDRFLFTSGRRSPHHRHTGYGLVEGLEGEALEAVDRLEAICVALLTPRRPRHGALMGGRGARAAWRGGVEVVEGREPSGRPNLAARGALPPLALLCDRRVWWRFEEEGRGEELLLPGAERGWRRWAAACALAALLLGGAWWATSALLGPPTPPWRLR
ncbi:MAG: hypothetical protein FJ138_01350 [Deltaproteobacteria bacterium]|nr:hypothetical protein [Deltaproteobacteria bacterium]